jgi:hypothetical protein
MAITTPGRTIAPAIAGSIEPVHDAVEPASA